MSFKQVDSEVPVVRRGDFVLKNYTAAPFPIDRYGTNEILVEL